MTKDLQVIVDQPVAGHYYWTVVDLGVHGEEHAVVDYARGPLPTRSSAMNAGLAALVGHRQTDNPWLGQLSGAEFGWNSDTGPGALQRA